jgi:hypothetical protein
MRPSFPVSQFVIPYIQFSILSSDQQLPRLGYTLTVTSEYSIRCSVPSIPIDRFRSVSPVNGAPGSQDPALQFLFLDLDWCSPEQ